MLWALIVCGGSHGWWSFVGGCRVYGGGQFMIVTVGSRCGWHSLCVDTVHGQWMLFLIHGCLMVVVGICGCLVCCAVVVCCCEWSLWAVITIHCVGGCCGSLCVVCVVVRRRVTMSHYQTNIVCCSTTNK